MAKVSTKSFTSAGFKRNFVDVSVDILVAVFVDNVLHVNIPSVILIVLSSKLHRVPITFPDILNDVVVTKDGDKIKIDVPAIIFDANQATFDAQPINIKRQNKKVLDNVAKILVEYKDYKANG